MIIAVDGPAASGKGTLARRLAAHYGLHFLDTGLFYRAVAWQLLEDGKKADDEPAAVEIAARLDLGSVTETELRTAGIGDAASIVAANPNVRTAILEYQRRFAGRDPGAVLDGRDIGTVVCPDADCKLFVTASPEVRARRRGRELRAAGHDISDDEVLTDLLRRDERDQSRAVAPLRPADDAHLLDTTNLDIEAAFRAAVAIVDGS
jgi:CMP/dCMP kinase